MILLYALLLLTNPTWAADADDADVDVEQYISDSDASQNLARETGEQKNKDKQDAVDRQRDAKKIKAGMLKQRTASATAKNRSKMKKKSNSYRRRLPSPIKKSARPRRKSQRQTKHLKRRVRN